MKLSWSHKMFLRINAKIGKKPWLDSLMYFCGQWLIWFLFLDFIFFVGKEYAATGEEIRIVQSFAVFTLGYGLSYGVALLYPHKRPKKEFEEIKELIHTFGTWKSFPSDHTIAITILACLLAFLVRRGMLCGCMYLLEVWWQYLECTQVCIIQEIF